MIDPHLANQVGTRGEIMPKTHAAHGLKNGKPTSQSVLGGKRYYHNYLSSKYIKNIDDLSSLIEKDVGRKKLLRRVYGFIENPRIPSVEGIKTLIFSK